MGPYDNADLQSSGKIKWKREDVACVIVDFESAKERMSQRRFAEESGIKRTTLQHWLNRKNSLDASAELIEFFESPHGIAFVHRLVTAAHFEFCKNGPASIHNVSNFLKLCGLEAFVAASYCTQRKVSNNMDKAIVSFGESERARLAENMPEKWITLCEDETFHPDICMVAIEAASNFIILEEYVEKRDSQTWNRVVKEALEGLPVKVVQVASDEAKGLVNHAEKGLGAHHSPDVFHVSREIGKGTSGPLAGAVKKAEKQMEEAARRTRTETGKMEKYDNLVKRPPGRRPCFEKRISMAAENQKQAEAALDAARKNQETVRQAKRDIGNFYHPYAPETGEKQDAEKVSKQLESVFEKINGAIEGLPERCGKRVEKARRVVGNMVASVAFFFVIIGQYMDNAGITGHKRQIANEYLIPGFYLREAASKEKDEIRKDAICEKSDQLLSILWKKDGPLSVYCAEEKKMLERAAMDCAKMFQRSSSCVEGRNAQLSLRHHGIHRLSGDRLKALTVMHNFHIKNRDGTTSAQRFFEAEHNNLFEWLLDKMDYPARPRKRNAMAA